MAVGAIIKGIGTALGIGGAIQGTQERRRAKRENARIARENASIAKQRAELQVQDIREAGSELESRQRAMIGASGVTREGSAADILREGKRATAEDIMTTRMLGADTARQFSQQGDAFTREARSIRKLAPFQIGSSLLTAGADIFKENPGMGTKLQSFFKGK